MTSLAEAEAVLVRLQQVETLLLAQEPFILPAQLSIWAQQVADTKRMISDQIVMIEEMRKPTVQYRLEIPDG